MKLVVLLSIAALVACDYSASQPDKPSEAFATPDKVEAVEESLSPVEPGKTFFKFNNVYRGAFPPTPFPSTNFFSSSSFHTFGHPLKTFNFAASPQGILPPISQIIPPQISQIVPPISQIVPPIFGQPSLPAPSPSPVVPPQTLPPQAFPTQTFPPAATAPLLSKFNFPYYSPLYQYPYAFPSSFPSSFSSSFPSFAFPSSTFFSTAQKQPSKTQTEPLSTSYGPPASGTAEPEPSGPAESSAPFEPSPVSFPYEPAVPEPAEPAAPHKPAQEYGLPPAN